MSDDSKVSGAGAAATRSEATGLPEAMSAEILTSMKDGVIAVGRDGRILLLNPVAEQLFGLKAKTAVNRPFGETFMAEEGFDEFSDRMLDAIYNPGVPQTLEMTLTPGGQERHVVVRTNRLAAADSSEAEGMVAVVSDVSERVNRLRERVEQERVRSAAGRFIIAVLAIFGIFTLTLEPMQKIALAGGIDVGPLVALAALTFTAIGIKWWTGLPAKTLGLTWHISRRDLWESVVWSLIFCAVLTVAKWIVLRVILGMPPEERALFEFWVLDNGEVVTSVLLYLAGVAFFTVTTPLQEIGTRSALQAPLQTFLGGVVRYPGWTANILTTLMFAVLHAHLNPVVAMMVVVPSLFWGWLFQRSGTVVSPTISHIIIGIYAVFILGLFVGFDQR